MLAASRLVMLSASRSNLSNALVRCPQTRLFTQRTSRLEKIVERRRTLRETLTQPAAGTAFETGKVAVAGASLLGIGALCYYGAGLSDGAGTLERSMAWPDYVRERVKSTYSYFGGSLLLTAGSAISLARNPTVLRLASSSSIPMMLGSIALVVGSGMLVRSMPYQPGLDGKKFAWAAHSALLGAMLAPMCLLGGPLMIRAAWYTAGVVGGLSAVAVCAPSDKFLYMGGPLGIGLGVVFMSSIGSMFLSPATALGSGLYAMSLYGGLVLFGGFMLYDTQKIMHRAETQVYYDPINQSMGIYMDTLNIFIRIATILAGGGGRKR